MSRESATAPLERSSTGTVRRVSIVGSTGSIGTQALDVIRTDPERYVVESLGARSSVELLASQAREFRPRTVALGDEARAGELAELLPPGTELRVGPAALESLATCGDVVVNAVVGFAGLNVTVGALASGRRLALANKESLIAGAPVVQVARATAGAEIVPVDSEHCAIHQCLGARHHRSAALGASPADFLEPPYDVRRLVVTASGGPFRNKTTAELATVTLEQALAHPTWKMGPKITIDSSTLMNKGLEVIEAHELFGVGFDDIDVVVHPQSIIHSMVEFCDGATIAQLSEPDMRLPIGYALSYPERLPTPFGCLDWSTLARLDFAPPDAVTFPCLALAYAAGRAGGSAPAWLNAANEVAVAAFLEGRISWLAIADIVAATLDAHEETKLVEVEDVLAADAAARRSAAGAVARRE
jgi:1-deoxy-D-xylulose-5-phosphate reductoisomerase